MNQPDEYEIVVALRAGALAILFTVPHSVSHVFSARKNEHVRIH